MIAPVEAALPVAPELASGSVESDPNPNATLPGPSVIVVQRELTFAAPPSQPDWVIPPVPWSGSGRFVGGAVMLAAGVGLLTAATLEFADGRDTTRPIISHVPAGVAMLVAGGAMIGTGARDQHHLSAWEVQTGHRARPSGNGLIVGGVTATTLGVMAGIATSIAADMDLDAPLSIPAGWTTAGVAMGGGAALMIAGFVRRARYGKWRDGLHGVPLVAPTRAGATVGFVGEF